MQKQLFSLLFSMILLTVVALPTIDEVILDAFDIEIEISIDEEESKEKETKTLEFNVLLEEEDSDSNMALDTSNIHNYYQNSYSDLYLECFCPPPEYI
jgi:type III secretory pathway lipoprotein EscJ